MYFKVNYKCAWSLIFDKIDGNLHSKVDLPKGRLLSIIDKFFFKITEYNSIKKRIFLKQSYLTTIQLTFLYLCSCLPCTFQHTILYSRRVDKI